jgi:CYTH domain-containing protein
MSKEIEKKYLIKENDTIYFPKALSQMYSSMQILKSDVIKNGKPIRQGYMPIDSGLELIADLGLNIDFAPTQARLRDKAKVFYFTLKGQGNLSRDEFNVEIEKDIFDKYWPETKGKRLEKIRLEKQFGDYIAEFDVYANRDLITAEVEVPTESLAEKLDSLGYDVTEEKKYKNINLAN